MNMKMKQWWQKQAVRINALSLRERVFLFISLMVCCLALADFFWFSPAQMAYKQTIQRFAQQNTDLNRLRAELQAIARPVDPSKVLRDEIAVLQPQLEAINQDIRLAAPEAEGGAELEQALVQFLRRHEGLTLLGTDTAPLDAAGQPKGKTPPGLVRRGVELRVSGPYAELVRYVKSLETALPTLRWGTLQLKTAPTTAPTSPPELVLQVYVLGVQP